MNSETIKSSYFINNLPEQAQKLFHTNPKQFKVLYGTKLVDIVKQDLFQMIQIVTPVCEVVYYSDFYDAWQKRYYWYNIKHGFEKNAKDLFKIYCSNGIKNIYTEDKSKLEATNIDFFNLLRAVYYYENYKDKKMWKMPHIQPLHSKEYDVNPKIVYYDFVDEKFNYKTKKTSVKINKMKTELGKQITAGCQKIADYLTDCEITRIVNINNEIKRAKEILAKYGTEIIYGY